LIQGWFSGNGLGSSQPGSSWVVYSGVVEVTIYVAEHNRGLKIGATLMDALVRRFEEVGLWMLQASNFPENMPSLELNKKVSFRLVGR